MYHLAKSIYHYATSKEEYSILLLGLDNAGKTTLLSAIKALYRSPAAATTTTTTTTNKNTAATATTTTTTANLPLPPRKTIPTVGQNVATISTGGVHLKFWDVGGQDALRGLWTGYYARCHAIVFVIDSSDVGDGNDEDPSSFFSSASLFPPSSSSPPATSELGSSPPSQPPLSLSLSQPPLSTTTAAAQPAGTSHHTGRLSECRAVLENVLASEGTTGIPVLVLANKQDREDCVETVRIKEGLVRRVFEGGKGGGVRDSRVLPVSALLGTGVVEAVEWVRTRVAWNREGRPPVVR